MSICIVRMSTVVWTLDTAMLNLLTFAAVPLLIFATIPFFIPLIFARVMGIILSRRTILRERLWLGKGEKVDIGGW